VIELITEGTNPSSLGLDSCGSFGGLAIGLVVAFSLLVAGVLA
jgi:hypothetical protein